MRESPGRGLTAEGFEALLAMLHPDRETAGERYEDIRRRLVRLFEWRGCARSGVAGDRCAGALAPSVLDGPRNGGMKGRPGRPPGGVFCSAMRSLLERAPAELAVSPQSCQP